MILISTDKTVHCTAPVIEKITVDGVDKIKICFDPADLTKSYLLDDVYGEDSEIIDGVEVPNLAIKYKYVDGQFIPGNS